MTEAKQRYNQWMQSVTLPHVKQQLEQMTEEQIENAFYKELEFGTGGLRGTMGAGSNCLNEYTIIKATIGLAIYMQTMEKKTAVITYDSRLNSKEFSMTTACTLASFGIKVYVTQECMPTPFVSFATRYLHCDMAVNITASHNPKEYNGYKVYDQHGCQVLDEEAKQIIEFVNQADPFAITLESFEHYLANGLICYVPTDTEEQYVSNVIEQGLSNCDGLNVLYTPLNGAGYRITPQVLRATGVTNLTIVPEQSYPDGNFETCPYPNPEKHEALQLALELAKEKCSDIVVANDPDCDRLGVAVRHNGEYQILSGNEVGILLSDYIFTNLARYRNIPANAIVVKTIVTSPMIDAIASKYGVTVQNVLTGFKYIGDVINKLEKRNKEYQYLFGFEESCGYLKGTYVRDKDGVVATMLVCEMAAYYKRLDSTLVDRLNELFAEFGCYSQRLVSYKFAGADGAQRKQQLLDDLRAHPLDNVAGSPVCKVEDLLLQNELPKADVVVLHAENGNKLIVRPSGTEPLIKCYLFVSGSADQNEKVLDQIVAQLDGLFA